MKKTLALSLSIALIGSGFNVGDAWASAVAQSVAAGSGKAVGMPVVLPVGGSLGAGAMTPLSGASVQGMTSVLPSLSMVAPTLTPGAAAPQKAVAPRGASISAPIRAAAAPVAAAAVGTGLSPVQGASGSSVKASVAAPTRAKGAAAVTRSMTKQVGDAVASVGPVSQASHGAASGLGRRLINILTGRRSANDSSAPVPGESAAMSSKRSGLKKADTRGLNATQKKMLQLLDNVASIYTEHYAPKEWKEKIGVDFQKEYSKVRQEVVAKPDMSTREFQKLLAGFVNATKDYHTGITFFSTEMSRLPFHVMEAEGKYYLAHVDRMRLPESRFPFKAGDELVEFDGRPVQDTINKLMDAAGRNVPTTDARMAEMRLTNRARQMGDDVPSGDVGLKIKTQDGQVKSVTLRWDYSPEMIPQDVPVRDSGLRPESGILDDLEMPAEDGAGSKKAFNALREMFRKLVPFAGHPHAQAFQDLLTGQQNPFMIGARDSYVPKLGKVIWEIDKRSPIAAAIYEAEDGRKIGYVRVPHYMGEQQEVQIFAGIIQKLEAETDSLVLDQINNPGGNIFYTYALLSFLSDKPMEVPKHRVLADESDAYWAAQVIKQASQPMFRRILQSVVKLDMFGMAAAMAAAMQPVVEYARFILSELKAGRRFTKPTHIMGVKQIDPHPMVHYTKPILMLVNALDFSGGDFFPAILQDNKRVTIMGVRTSGAGGAVKGVQMANQFGVAQLAYTWTIAQRKNGQPIENLGVTPDIDYKPTANDLRAGFSDYKKAILEALRALMPAVAPAVAPKPEARRIPIKALPEGPKRKLLPAPKKD